jgi:hypothetical protein
LIADPDCVINQSIINFIINDFPIPPDPIIKKNGCFLDCNDPRLDTIVLYKMYCSSGRLNIAFCGKIGKLILKHPIV